MSEVDRPALGDRIDALSLKVLQGRQVRVRDEGYYILAGTSVRDGLARVERLTPDGRDVERLTVSASEVFWPDPYEPSFYQDV